jgi:hypothetical protein
MKMPRRSMPTPRARAKTKTKCACAGYFSAFDHARVPPGRTCQFLVDRHKASVEWHDAFTSRVSESLGADLSGDFDPDEVPF